MKPDHKFPMPHSIKRRLFISLGRHGDILNILPVVKAWHDDNELMPLLMVADEFMPMVTGLSYLEAVSWRGRWQHCVEAEETARASFPEFEIVNCAVYGIGYKFHRQSRNYQREAWRLAGSGDVWGSLPLVLDNRNSIPEIDVKESLFAGAGWGEPYVVTSFSGVSTPFHEGAKVIEAIKARGHRVIDISNVKAPRITDLLGIMESAQCIICSDSAPLHLAAAVNHVPVLALISDQSDRWQRSDFTPQHKVRMWYSEAIVHPDSVADQVDKIVKETVNTPRFAHVYCFTGPVEAESHRRMCTARDSWLTEYQTGRWIECPISADQLKRDSSTVYGDPKPAPFYKDVIDIAAAKLRPNDVIVLSNADVGVVPGFTGQLIDAMRRSPAVFTHRWDSDHRIDSPPVSEDQVQKLNWYPGSDCWAFRVSWWLEWRDQYPDMMMGREAGDLILRHLVKNHGGIEIPVAIWHEKHPSYWEHHGLRDSLPGNQHNRVLATQFFYQFGGDWNDGKMIKL